MMLHHQILLNLARAAIAEVILMQISAEQVPSLHRELHATKHTSKWQLYEHNVH